MVNKKITIFVDTSFFKALIDPKDEFYSKASEIWKTVTDAKLALVSTNFILDEMLTLMRKRCGMEAVERIRTDLLETKLIKIIRVTITDEAKAWDWFIKDWSDLSFTDCVSFAVMKRLDLKKVLTFDNHFSRAGFEIVSP